MIISKVTLRAGELAFVLTSPSDLMEVTADYERKVTEYIMSSLQEDGVFIDVGAHIGVHSFRIASLFPKASIISIEPNPIAFEALILGIKANNLYNVNAPNLTLSDIDGEITLHVKLNTAASSIIESQGSFKSIKVKAMRLDTLVETLKLDRIDVIKVDVEGAELEVLKGAINTLKNYKPKIIAEVRKRNMELFLNIISTLGYTCKVIEEKEIDVHIFCYSATPSIID
ncbi:MAG: FkbM family methyltransferase [Candidatus Nezhaarchaeales archaeon]